MFLAFSFVNQKNKKADAAEDPKVFCRVGVLS
jgi:hypothetical protein